jgi:hypothetical protein
MQAIILGMIMLIPLRGTSVCLINLLLRSRIYTLAKGPPSME